MRIRLAVLCLVVLSLILPCALSAQLLQPVGPAGGDVRSLVADPRDARVLYLGTADGHLFASRDGGERWEPWSRIGDRRDTVVMWLVVDVRDSKTLYAGTWTLGGPGGGVYRSDDRGRTWRHLGLEGKTVRMLAQSSKRPETLAAATVQGVFRSNDGGRNWEMITPANHIDLRNFDSVTIDPRDEDVVYAGTYHLAWKTNDGGRNWTPIHKGMIDDSDVMDIELDRTNPDRVFATACSGMYRSENRGELWAKIQGIPSTARRTHLIQQDPQNPQTFYAGTTQGLWKSTDDTKTWKRITPADYSIIGVVIDPKNPERLVIGTERRGIFISQDGGLNFRASNEGFYHQQIVAFAVDAANPSRMLLVLTNSVQPVMMTADSGRTWRPLGGNLRVEELRRVYGAEGVWWAAQRRGGLLRYDEKKAAWVRAGVVRESRPAPAAKPAKAPAKSKKPAPATIQTTRELAEAVYDIAFTREAWYAATYRGAFVSRDRGTTWSEFSVGANGRAPVHSMHVEADGSRMLALTSRAVLVSTDGGRKWESHAISFEEPDSRVHHISGDAFAITTSRGLYLSKDGGASWESSHLPEAFLSDFAVVDGVYVAATGKGGLYLSRDAGRHWTLLEETAGERFPLLKQIEESRIVLAASATEGLRSLQAGELRARASAQASSTPAAVSGTAQQKK